MHRDPGRLVDHQHQPVAIQHPAGQVGRRRKPETIRRRGEPAPGPLAAAARVLLECRAACVHDAEIVPAAAACKRGARNLPSRQSSFRGNPMTDTPQLSAVETYCFADDGTVPNSALPLVVYRGALPESGDRAVSCEAMFARNGWPDAWRNGIYPYHHYHSTAHEVLGIARGHARVRIG